MREKKELGINITRIAVGMSIVSLLLSLVLTTLLTAARYQLQTTDPLNSPALSGLLEQLKNDGGNETVKKQIREMDLLARKAFFGTQEHIRTGVNLLLLSLVVLLVSLNLIVILNPRPPHPEACAGINNPFTSSIIARRCMIGGILMLFAAIAYLSFTTPSNLTEKMLQPKSGEPETSQSNPGYPNPFTAQHKEDTAPTREELAANWPYFRGLDGNAITTRTKPPTVWDGKTGKNILWKVRVAKPGLNSPIVWNETVFLSGGDAKERRIFAFNRKDGSVLWQRDVCGIRGSPATPPEVSADTGYAAATMATDGQRVFAVFATGDIIAFTVKGENCWGINLGVPGNHYGHSSSLIMHKDILVVQFDHSEESRLIGIQSATGKILYDTDRNAEISWASPLLVHASGKTAIVLVDSKKVAAYDASNGKELWNVECMGGEVASSPAYANGVVYVAADGGCAAAIEMSTGKVKWKTDELDLPDVASPLAVGKHIYLATSTGLLIAVDTVSGKKVWEQECTVGFYSSPVLVGENIYVTDMTGTTIIFKPGDTYTEISRAKLGAPVVSTPAFVDERIYVRGGDHLYCIGTKDE